MKKGNLKKIISFVLALCLVLSMMIGVHPQKVNAAEPVKVIVSTNKTTLNRGERVKINVKLSGNTRANGVQLQFTYDKNKIQLVENGLTEGEAFEGATLKDLYGGTAGVITAVIMRLDGAVEGNVFTAEFIVKDSAAKGAIETNIADAQLVEQTTEGATPISANIINEASGLRVSVPATGLVLDKEAMTIARGETGTLKASLMPSDADAEITWGSDNTAVATVENGVVRAIKKGTANITAAADGYKAVCKVTVNVPIHSITIAAQDGKTTIKKGEQLQLKVVYDPEDTDDDKRVSWTSSEESVAVISSMGLVTAKSDGSTMIEARVGNKTAQYKIEVKEVPLAGISFADNKTELTIHRGDTDQLNVVYNPTDTTDDKTVIWESSAPEVVEVDGNGRLTAKDLTTNGEVLITAKVGRHTAGCRVTVDAPLQNIKPEKSSIEMMKGQSAVIRYKVVPEDTTDATNVNFKSSNTDVVEVDTNGKLTAKKAGEAVVTLSSVVNSDITASISVKVTEIPINEVVLDKQAVVVEKGENTTLTAVVNPTDTTDDDKTITWTSSNPEIVTVSSDTTKAGEAVTVAATDKGGNVIVTATAWNGTKAECVITVPIHLESISIEQDVEMLRNDTKALEVIYDPENTTDNKKVTWSSDKPEIASVDPVTGMIMAKAEGKAVITATSIVNNEITATTTVTVKENHLTADIAEDIKFSEIKPMLKGQKINLNDFLNLKELLEANRITDEILMEWQVEDNEIATIDSGGILLGVKEGKTAITVVVTALNSVGDEIGRYMVSTDIEVQEIPLESIAFDKIIKEMKVGEIQVLGILYNPDNTTDVKKAEWKSSDATIISVENGKLTALKAGEAEITAKVGDKAVSCKITVRDNAYGTGDKNIETSDKNNKTDKRQAVKTADTGNVLLYIITFALSVWGIWILIRKKVSR